MDRPAITIASKSHLRKILGDLVAFGWSIESVPVDGKIPQNRLKVVLRFGQRDVKLRLIAHKVTSSSRNRPQERRVEITTTYLGGLQRARGYADVVLAVDTDLEKYVGVDPRRLNFGGATHNASSFFDLEGLSVRRGELIINPRQASRNLFSREIEFHAFFGADRLSEYLLNHRDIHAGTYTGGAVSVRKSQRRSSLKMNLNLADRSGDCVVLTAATVARKISAPKNAIEALEQNDLSSLRQRQITPEQLQDLQKVCDEVGVLGEQFVLGQERKRLTRLGFKRQAARVQRVSLHSVSEGYDILSFENDGKTRRYIEVKATVGSGSVIDISRGEWRTAERHRQHYYLARVTQTKTDPAVRYVQDPVQYEKDGAFTRTATGWRVDLKAVLA